MPLLLEKLSQVSEGRRERSDLGPRVARQAVARLRHSVALDDVLERVEGFRQVPLHAAAGIQVRRAGAIGKRERECEGLFEIVLRGRDGDRVFGRARGAILQDERKRESETKQATPPGGSPYPRTSTPTGWW